jgi:hypothetical protein
MELTIKIDSSQIDHHGEVELADEMLPNASDEALLDEIFRRGLEEEVLERSERQRRDYEVTMKQNMFNYDKGTT